MNGFVYFIRCSATCLVKIGWAKSPEERLRTLQTGSAGKLTIVGVRPGTKKDESHWHGVFSSLRKRGEWFALTPADIAKACKALPRKPGPKPRPCHYLHDPEEWAANQAVNLVAPNGEYRVVGQRDARRVVEAAVNTYRDILRKGGHAMAVERYNRELAAWQKEVDAYKAQTGGR